MTRNEILEERRRLKAEYGEIFDSVTALLFRHDPMGINFDSNTDEYEPEVGTILPCLQRCITESDVVRVVHQEFIRWFSAEEAGPITRYEPIGAEIWLLWKERMEMFKKR